MSSVTISLGGVVKSRRRSSGSLVTSSDVASATRGCECYRQGSDHGTATVERRLTRSLAQKQSCAACYPAADQAGTAMGRGNHHVQLCLKRRRHNAGSVVARYQSLPGAVQNTSAAASPCEIPHAVNVTLDFAACCVSSDARHVTCANPELISVS